MLVAAVVGALAIAGIVGYVALRPEQAGDATARRPPAHGDATDARADDAASPAATAPRHGCAPARRRSCKVRVNSDPDGASVKEDGVELCSSTPCDILYKGSDADPDARAQADAHPQRLPRRDEAP